MSGFRRWRLTAGLTLAAAALVALTSVSAAFAQVPANDNRGAAELTSGANVNLLRSNDYNPDSAGDGGEPGEDLNCSGAPFDSTVWFQYDPPVAGTAVYTVAGGAQSTGDADGGEPGDDGLLDTVMQLYDSSGALQTCNDDSGNAFQSQTSAFYGAGNPSPVLIQVGGYDYGGGTFYEQGLFTFVVNYSPATRVSANLKYRYQIFPKFLRLTKMAVTAESGTTIEVDCRGGGCFKGTKEYSQSPVNLKKLFGKRIRFGTAIDVFVTEPGRFGYYARLKIKPKPRKLSRCLSAGDVDPVLGDISPCPG